MSAVKKITVHISADLLEAAQKSSGQGITETIRMGLKLIAAKHAYKKLLSMKGKISFSRSFKKIKEERE